MARRRRSLRKQVAEELEMLPMMNLFVVLIPMLLLSAVFLEMSVIRMNLPGDDEADERPKETLGLTVAIRDGSWLVKGRGIGSQVIDRDGGNGEEELRAALADVSARFPDEQGVVVMSPPRTRYEDIITVMDVTRESGFPNVSLAGGDG